MLGFDSLGRTFILGFGELSLEFLDFPVLILALCLEFTNQI